MAKYASWAVRLIGPVLLIIFLVRSDISKLWLNMSGLTLWPLALSLALFAPFVAVKAWRWRLVMRELGMQPPPLGFAMALYTIGLYAGGLTPGQSGDFIKGWYLRDRGLPLAPVLFSIVLDRLFDFAVMAALALAGLVVLIDVFPPDLRGPLRVAILAFAAAIFTLTPLLMARGPRELFFRVAAWLVPARFRPTIERLHTQFGALSLRPAPLAALLLASAGSAISTLVRVGLLYLTLPLGQIPLIAIVGSTALIAILQALPISFAGVGVRDGVLIALLQYYGYSSEQALVLSAQFLLINIEHILLGFLISLRYPLAATVGAPDAGEPAAPPAQGSDQ
jgi:uncharacterized protein (TIRG00374 family)